MDPVDEMAAGGIGEAALSPSGHGDIGGVVL